MYRSLLNFFSKNAGLKTIVIPLSTVFTRILIKSPKCAAYLSNNCNLQLKSLLHLGQNVITFRTLLHLEQNVIAFRTLLHLGTMAQKGHTCQLKMLLQTKILPAN